MAWSPSQHRGDQPGAPAAALAAGRVGAPPGRWATFVALEGRDFRLFWLAMLGSVYGLTTEFVALGWLVLVLTDSPLNLGTVGLARALPNIILSFVGGTMADRVDRRRLLVLTHGSVACLFFALGILVTTQLIEVWHVYVLATILGCVRAFDSPVRNAIIPYIAPKEHIPSAVALVNMVWQLPRLVGPATAGILIATVGIGPTFYVAGTAVLGATILFGLLHIVGAPPAARGRSFLGSVVDGLDFIRRSPLLYALIAMTFFNSIFGMSYTTLLPVFARDLLHVGSQGLGWLHTASASGGLVGVLLAARLTHAPRKGRSTLWGAAAYGLLLIGFSVSAWFPLSLLLIFSVSLANQIYMTIINTVFLLDVPDDYRGRVMGVYGLAWSIVPFGGTVSGAVAELAGASVAVGVGGVLVAGMALVVAATIPRVRQLD